MKPTDIGMRLVVERKNDAHMLILFLIAVVVIVCTSVQHTTACEPKVDTVKAQGWYWMIKEKTLIRTDTTTGEQYYPSVQVVQENRLDDETRSQFSTTYYPTMIRLSSVNSSLVPGKISRVFVRNTGSVLFVSEAGDVSILENEHWETINGLCATKRAYHKCLNDAILDSNELRVITCTGVCVLDLKTYHLKYVLNVSSWSNTRPTLASPDKIILCGDLRGWYSLSTGTSSISDSVLRHQWIRTDPASFPAMEHQLKMSLKLRQTLLPELAWELGSAPYLYDTSEFIPHDLLAPLPDHSSHYELALDLAVDQQENIYCATTHGVIILPRR